VTEDSCDVVVVATDAFTAVTHVEDHDRDATQECSGPEAFNVQGIDAGSTQWRTLREHATSHRVSVNGLSPSSAYQLRLQSVNRVGVSVPGDSTIATASLPIIPGLPMSILRRMPIVRPTSSASFDILGPETRASCQMGLTWLVMARFEGQTQFEDQGEWEVLGTVLQGETLSLERLRCPLRGCRFKLRPDVRLWDESSHVIESPSILVQNTALPPVASPDLTVRMELQLRGTAWDNLLRQQLCDEIAEELSMDAPTVVEAHVGVGGVSVVLDLHSDESGKAEAKLRQLMNVLSAIGGAPTATAAGTMLSRIEPSEIMQQSAYDGTWSFVASLTGAQGSWLNQLLDHWLSLARWGALALISTCLLGLAAAFLRWYYCRRSRGNETHGLLDAEEDGGHDDGDLSDVAPDVR
jgi:hypothetical protein